MRERQTVRDRETETERQRQTESDRDRQRDRDREGQSQTETEGERENTNNYTNLIRMFIGLGHLPVSMGGWGGGGGVLRQTDRQTDRHIEKQREHAINLSRELSLYELPPWTALVGFEQT